MAERAVERPTKKPKRVVHHGQAKADAGVSGPSVKPTTAKEARIVKVKPFAKVSGRLGALSLISTMPWDVLLEICRHLDHETLFTLSVTLKPFRTVLLEPFAKTIWVDSRARIGLPDLKAGDLKEWQYANLVWSKTCQICGKKGVVKADFTLRVRMCPACIKTRVVDEINLPVDIHHVTTQYCLSSYDEKSGYLRFKIRDLRHYETILSSKFEDGDGEWDSEDFDFDEDVENSPLLLERQPYYRARTKDGDALQGWLTRYKQLQSEDKKRVGRDRKADIERRLREDKDHSWGDSDFEDPGWNNDTTLTVPTPITDRGWKTLVPRLLPGLTERKQFRAVEARKLRIFSRRQEIEDLLYPHFIVDLDDDQFGTSPVAIDIFARLQIPLRVFFALRSVRHFWEDDTFPVIGPALKQLDLADRRVILDEVKQWNARACRAFFDLLVTTNVQAISKYPDSGVQPISIVDPANPTKDEISTIVSTFPPILVCQLCSLSSHRTNFQHSFGRFLNHYHSCPNRKTDSLADLDFEPETYVKVASGLSRGAGPLVLARDWAILRILERTVEREGSTLAVQSREKRLTFGDTFKKRAFYCHIPHATYRAGYRTSDAVSTDSMNLAHAYQHALGRHRELCDINPSHLEFSLFAPDIARGDGSDDDY